MNADGNMAAGTPGLPSTWRCAKDGKIPKGASLSGICTLLYDMSSISRQVQWDSGVTRDLRREHGCTGGLHTRKQKTPSVVYKCGNAQFVVCEGEHADPRQCLRARCIIQLADFIV